MESDVVIAVLGMTGVGKSSFIKNLTNSPDIVIGHGLASETNEVKGYEFTHCSRRYTLIDTPGFDDTFQSDESITRLVLEWLQSSYQAGTRLNGIIYVHSIAQPRLQGSAFDNLCMIRRLCGEGSFSRVVLATTFWNEVDAETASEREFTLLNNQHYWGRMADLGSRATRLHNSRYSALETLRVISMNSKGPLQAQTEMADQGLTPGETSAAQFVHSGLRNSADEHSERMREMWEEETRKQEQRRLEMQEELKEKEARLEEINNQAEEERKRLLRAYHKNHVCRCRLIGKARCANCGVSIRKVFYHCCWCGTITTFFHCAGCGKQCLDQNHPTMKRQETYCIVM